MHFEMQLEVLQPVQRQSRQAQHGSLGSPRHVSPFRAGHTKLLSWWHNIQPR